MTKSGVIGDPTLGTVEKGEFILQVMRDQANFKMESGAGSKVVNHACDIFILSPGVTLRIE